MAEDAPIAFIHYGPSAYLRFTLRAAQRSNPGKKIFFLGDETNRRFCPPGVEFAPFARLAAVPKIASFRSLFRPIEGTRHRFNKHGGTARWLGFVFERWFLLEEFARSSGLERFWTFDSDTMVAADLRPREEDLSSCEATEQCGGRCLNGLVNSTRLLAEFTSHILRIYADEDFLARHEERLARHSGLALNEMDVWQDFRDLRKPATRVLGQPRNGELFDDALALVAGFVPARAKVCGRIPVKKVALDRRGGAFAFSAGDDTPLRLVTLNLSWLPDHIFRRVLPYCRPVGRAAYDAARCRELDPGDSLLFTLRRMAARWRLPSNREAPQASPA